jgi:hypothetical protein
MPRDTQPPEPDQLYARVIFTPAEYQALTSAELVLLDEDLQAELDAHIALGWTFDVEDVVTGVDASDAKAVIVYKQVAARPYGVQA